MNQESGDLEAASSRSVARFGEALVLIAIIGWALFYRIGGQTDPFWLDELHTSWVIFDGVDSIPQRAAAGNQHPLYFYLVWSVTEVMGHSEWSIRFLSLLGGVGCVAAVYLMVRSLTRGEGSAGSIAAATCASLLLAMEPLHVRYSIEGRVYALVSLVAVLQLLAYVECWKKITWIRAGLLIALSVCLFYLHYSTGVIILCEGLIWLCGATALLMTRRWNQTRESERPAVIPWLAGWTITWLMIAFVNGLAIGQIREVHARRGNWAFFIPDPSFWQTVGFGKWWPYLTISLLAAVILAVLYCLFASRNLGTGRTIAQRFSAVATRALHYRHVGLVAAMAVCVPLAMTLLTWLNVAPAYHARYLLPAAVFSVAASGCAVVLLPTCKWQIVTAVIIFLGIGLENRDFENLVTGRWERPGREGWREAVEELNASAEPNQPILVWAGLIEATSLSEARRDGELAEFSSLPLRGLYQPEQSNPLWALPLNTKSPQLRLFEEQYGSTPPQACWLIIRSQNPDRIERIIERNRKDLQKVGRYSVTFQEQFRGSVTLVKFTLSP